MQCKCGCLDFVLPASGGKELLTVELTSIKVKTIFNLSHCYFNIRGNHILELGLLQVIAAVQNKINISSLQLIFTGACKILYFVND